MARLDTSTNFTPIYFYFDLNDVEKKSAGTLVRSIAAQLYSHSSTRFKCLEELFDLYKDGSFQPSAGELLATLRKMPKRREILRISLVIDELDGCSNFEELIETLQLPRNLRFSGDLCFIIIATSRYLQEIVTATHLGIAHKICIESSIKDDISLYIDNRLKSDKTLLK